MTVRYFGGNAFTPDDARATFTNAIGAAELPAFWQDPDFQPSQRAGTSPNWYSPR